MDYKNILFESKNAIAYITVNRPKQLNALNTETIAELSSVITIAENPRRPGRRGLPHHCRER